jgi:hypothetical protein
MARNCLACTSNSREQIDVELLKGRPLAKISARFSITKSSLCRHKRHVTAALANSPEAVEMSRPSRLAAQLKWLMVDAQKLKSKAEKKRDYRTALVAVRELCRLLELAAKLSGELNERAQHNELHVHLPEERALAVARAYLARHAPGIESPVRQLETKSRAVNSSGCSADETDCNHTVTV